MVIRLLLLLIATEAIIELWKKAAPLQPLRAFLIWLTPFLYSRRQEQHLLNCPYCMSLWAGILAASAYYYWDIPVVKFAVIALALHRGSNFLHLAFSYLQDKQFDLRVARRFKGGT